MWKHATSEWPIALLTEYVLARLLSWAQSATVLTDVQQAKLMSEHRWPSLVSLLGHATMLALGLQHM